MSTFNGSTNAQDSVQLEKKNRIRSFFLSLIIIVVFFFLFGKNFQAPVSIELTETSLTLSGNSDDVVTMAYEDITSVALVDSVDFGEMVNGAETTKGSSGIWKNDQWGEYHLFITAKLDEYLIFTDSDSTVLVFNYESKDVTETFYSSFYDLMERDGLADQIAFSSFLDAE